MQPAWKFPEPIQLYRIADELPSAIPWPEEVGGAVGVIDPRTKSLWLWPDGGWLAYHFSTKYGWSRFDFSGLQKVPVSEKSPFPCGLGGNSDTWKFFTPNPVLTNGRQTILVLVTSHPSVKGPDCVAAVYDDEANRISYYAARSLHDFGMFTRDFRSIPEDVDGGMVWTADYSTLVLRGDGWKVKETYNSATLAERVSTVPTRISQTVAGTLWGLFFLLTGAKM